MRRPAIATVDLFDEVLRGVRYFAVGNYYLNDVKQPRHAWI